MSERELNGIKILVNCVKSNALATTVISKRMLSK
jgi:hypothetical protein